ncbi:hypothetical protein GCM10022251_28110 [Phytohabitans flavus]|uniref:Uncharacterized protein n=1 Tax=Phytohabitans flavus TaxID=1076124 RepID=A0A6F8XP31_9ACTN|nr:hypothetical protein [Phytohabitans flavus]BCB75576.1 hypothetical protein Pflav_019860 [Phytohabitans flavus]
MPAPYTDETALELARQLAPLLGLSEIHMPTAIAADVLNGAAECDALLARIPQERTPAPLTQLVAEWLP